MTVKVDLDQLAEAMTDFTFAYLITVGEDFRAHTVAVDPVLTEGVIHAGAAGRHTRANLAEHAAVTVIWPPREPGGYSLIVDGTGELSGDDVRVVPNRAVLHRKAEPEAPSATSGCLHDCVPIEKS
ncbi:hypothetical protein [Mycobacterium sp. 141]|uniref:hypothetical protein n=1 Tax=Mycobacterium sp. 141 TaxID=1120797 RepID=UPI000382217A|nr:hypothetical protein [Mycobacterium sp. 141]